MSTVLAIIAVIGLIGANAFFVADEFALVAVDRAQVSVRATENEKPWPTVQRLLSELSFHLSAAQVGITISSLVFGFLAAPVGRRLLDPIIDPLFGQDTAGWLTVPIAFALANILQVVLGEVVPKTLAIAEPIRVLKVLARGIAVWGFIVRPVVKVVNNMADAIVKKMGMEPSEELHGVASMSELEFVIRASGEKGTLDPEDVTRLTRTIRFGEKSAGDILVPRVDLAVVESDDTLADVCTLATSTGHSRFPVIGDDTDDILGVVHVKSALGVSPADRSAANVGAHMSDAFVVPEARELDSLLDEMYSDDHHLAFVLDEHGGLAGIVTIEDIVEEIVGEIDDEHDRKTIEDVQQVGDGQFMLAGAMHPDELEEATGMALPEGDYETVAGFALDQLQRIPAPGDEFDWESWSFEIIEMDRWRIAKIRATAAPAPINGEER